MAKFIIGVIVGVFLGATGGAYGAVVDGAGTVQGWTVAKDGEATLISNRHASAARTSKP
jgi:hypothetical protein